MTRFRRGTTDHDGDGKMGGSMKETDMATAKKPAANKPTIKADGQNQMSSAAAAQAEAIDAASAPRAARKAALEAEQARVQAKFDKADAAAEKALKDVPAEDLAVGTQVRGY